MTPRTSSAARAPGSPSGPGRRDVFPLAALGVLALVTVLWWAFALWPLPSEAPAWLGRARAICFNTTETGLPDASGWI
ncbi:MAG: hypothetical protein D6701_05885, partial [Gemmatimonadetes bacterium]